MLICFKMSLGGYVIACIVSKAPGQYNVIFVS